MHISAILERHFVENDGKYHFISVTGAKAEIEPLEIDEINKKQFFSKRKNSNNSEYYQGLIRDCA